MKPISLDDINSWSDFKSYAESMPNTKSMGDAFEQLTKLYFQINPLYRSKYKEVWLLDEVPSKDLEYLDLPRQDLGIDLIAKSGDEYHAIQCKYHSDKTNTVKNSEISTFTSILANKKNLSHGYICSTALNLIVRKTPRLLEGLVLIELALFLCWWSHLCLNQVVKTLLYC